MRSIATTSNVDRRNTHLQEHQMRLERRLSDKIEFGKEDTVPPDLVKTWGLRM